MQIVHLLKSSTVLHPNWETLGVSATDVGCAPVMILQNKSKRAKQGEMIHLP